MFPWVLHTLLHQIVEKERKGEEKREKERRRGKKEIKREKKESEKKEKERKYVQGQFLSCQSGCPYEELIFS